MIDFKFKTKEEIREFLERHPKNTIELILQVSPSSEGVVCSSRDLHPFDPTKIGDWWIGDGAESEDWRPHTNYSHAHYPKYQDPPLDTYEDRVNALEAGFTLWSGGMGFTDRDLRNWDTLVRELDGWLIHKQPQFNLTENKMGEMNLTESIEWMMKNRGKPIRVRNHQDVFFRIKMDGGLARCFSEYPSDEDNWTDINCYFDSFVTYINNYGAVIHQEETETQKRVREINSKIDELKAEANQLQESLKNEN